MDYNGLLWNEVMKAYGHLLTLKALRITVTRDGHISLHSKPQ